MSYDSPKDFGKTFQVAGYCTPTSDIILDTAQVAMGKASQEYLNLNIYKFKYLNLNMHSFPIHPNSSFKSRKKGVQKRIICDLV